MVKKKTSKTEDARSGTCALVGRPNVGKSTLLNALLGQKLAIVAQKPQTTRTSILGVLQADEGATQIAFIDTPGLHRPKNALGRALVEKSKAALADADVVVLLIEAGGKEVPDSRDAEALSIVQAAKRPTILAINKVDRVKDKTALLPVLEAYSKLHKFEVVVPLSAQRKINLDGLVKEIRARLPEGKIYDDEFFTDRPERFFAAEFVREAVIKYTRQEVPHSVAVVVEQFVDEPKITRIEASVLVEKESQKKIVIGARAAMLKTIGSEARAQIENMLGRKVFLGLTVRVAKDWTDDAEAVRDAMEGART